MSNHSPRKSRASLIIGLLIIACVAIAAFNIWRARHKTLTRVEKRLTIPVAVSRVTLRKLDWFTDVTGNLLPIRSTAVHAKIPGKIIKRIYVEKGDPVKKGQLLVSLEKEQVKAKLDRARAAVKVASARTDMLEKDYKRIENLFRKKAVPKQKLDHIQAELHVARAQLKEARAALKETKIFYNDHDIYAMQSGIVADRFVDPGNLTDKDVEILRICDESVLKLQLEIPEKDLPYVKKGMDVSFTADACPKKTFSGKVALIYPTIDPMTRTIRLEVHIQNKDHTLHAGMFVHVRLYFGKKQVLVIRREALNKMPGTASYYVYIVKNNRAHMKNIKVGIKQGNFVEVTSGLSEGDAVVIQGQNRLKDNMPVLIMNNQNSATR